MANKLKQYRFFSDPQIEHFSANEPSNATIDSFATGSVFTGGYPIKQLGIQTIPGVKFYLNRSPQAVIVGHSGIFSLDLAGQLEISSLQFDKNSLQNLVTPIGGYLIVDTIYDDGEG